MNDMHMHSKLCELRLDASASASVEVRSLRSQQNQQNQQNQQYQRNQRNQLGLQALQALQALQLHQQGSVNELYEFTFSPFPLVVHKVGVFLPRVHLFAFVCICLGVR
jgi:hypothetical protein